MKEIDQNLRNQALGLAKPEHEQWNISWTAEASDPEPARVLKEKFLSASKLFCREAFGLADASRSLTVGGKSFKQAAIMLAAAILEFSDSLLDISEFYSRVERANGDCTLPGLAGENEWRAGDLAAIKVFHRVNALIAQIEILKGLNIDLSSSVFFKSNHALRLAGC